MYGYVKISSGASLPSVWKSNCLRGLVFVKSKNKSSTSSQTSVFKEQVIFHSFSSVESVATTLRDDINDNSSRVFLGLIVPCLSKCALGHCATCDSDVGNFPSESRRKDPNWLPLQDFFLQMNFWTKEDSFLLRIFLKRRPFVILIPWFSTWQSQNSTTFWRKDLPTQLLHGIVGGISLWCHKLSQCDVLRWADSVFLQSTATFKSCWALWLWKLWLMMTLVSGNCILLTIYGNWWVLTILVVSVVGILPNADPMCFGSPGSDLGWRWFRCCRCYFWNWGSRQEPQNGAIS